jgi:hypothetical protein
MRFDPSFADAAAFGKFRFPWSANHLPVRSFSIVTVLHLTPSA